MLQLRASLFHDELPDDVVVTRFVVREALSEPFDIEVEFSSNDADLELEPLVWSGAGIELIDDASGADTLRFHGVIEEAEYLGALVAGTHAYRLRLRPAVHGLSYRFRTRTFQGKSAVDIVRQVMTDAGLPAAGVRWHTTASYPVRDFCLQYQESELAFVSRLLEDEGIFYWFEHEAGAHVMHLADAAAAHTPIDGTSAISFSTDLHLGREAVTELALTTSVTHDAYAARDWNYEVPATPLDATQNGAPAPVFERYEYPGYFARNTDGGRRAHNRLAEALLDRYVVEGASTCRRLHPGRTFEVADARPEALSRGYLLRAVEHAYDAAAARGRGDGSAVATAARPAHHEAYRARFTAVPDDMEFRPPRVTPRPAVAGKESAVVTTPGGEEIHVDEMGRIKVHFYFDREGAVDDHASFWLRTQQQNTAGAMILPRVGWEMSVAFVDGDPDRPVALQKLYNQETMPPYGLPANKTQSALQSSSTPGGGGTNEVRLQDGAGGMEFALHAQKDFALAAGHDMTEEITVDASEEVVQQLATTVGASESVKVGAKQSTSVTGNCTLQTTGSKTVSVSAMDDWGVTGNYSVSSGGDRSETVSGMMNVLANKVDEAFGAAHTKTVGAALCINAGTAIIDTTVGNKTESVGGAKLELVRNAKVETVTGAKTLVSGFTTCRTSKSMAVSAKAALTVNVAGAIAEKCGETYALGARLVAITAPGGAEFKAGGSSLVARGGKITVNASSLGAKGGPELKLKGRTINYK